MKILFLLVTFLLLPLISLKSFISSNPSNTEEILRVPQDFPTIQSAIDQASMGATIQIAAGVYTENITLTKSLTLQGSGVKETILQPVPGFRDRDKLNPILTVPAPPDQEISLRLSRLTLRSTPETASRPPRRSVRLHRGPEISRQSADAFIPRADPRQGPMGCVSGPSFSPSGYKR